MPVDAANIYNAAAIAPAIERLLGDGEHLPNVVESDSNATWPNGGGDHYGMVGGLAAALAAHAPLKGSPLVLPAVQSSPFWASYAPYRPEVPWGANEFPGTGVWCGTRA